MGNIIMWLYYGGEKSMNDVSEEDNQTVGIIVTLTLGFLIYFSFF